MAEDKKFNQESAFPEEVKPETPEEKHIKDEYRRRLAEKLKDPEFRKIEGFPLGTDEAIMALSDPPYYTACPNPFLPEILDQWQQERRQIRKDLDLPDDETLPEGFRGYHREPFAADVSEGKNDPIYNAHSYHTKVPHKAIMRYILHYTDPGDIVFDGFCGTGMTGVAAQLCGDKKVVESLGYRVDKKGIVYEGDKAISRLGARKAVLNDLSPAATFIAYNYNTPVDVHAFEKEAKRILAEVEKECGWMYETTHTDGTKGRINYTVWSDVFRCPHCSTEMAFWNVAVDEKEGNVKDTWKCPGCGSLLAKSPRKESGALKVERVIDTLYDQALDQTIKQARQIPVMINYSIYKKRFEKKPDDDDLALIKQIDESKIPYPFPIDKIPKGDKTSDTFNIGVTHTHQFYTKRNLWVLSSILAKPKNNWRNNFSFLITSFIVKTGSKLHNIGLKNGNINLAGAIPNALYIPSFFAERNIFQLLISKLQTIIPAYSFEKELGTVGLTTQSSTKNFTGLKNLYEYIFVDPPFGANLMYSELNFLWESWLKLFTNNQQEAIINHTQNKNLNKYQILMTDCYIEFYKSLIPNHWITVEFHNSQNSVWNSIQEALMFAGFIVADIRTIDKQQGTFNQMTTTGAVKQDLIISAYKPAAEFERKFSIEGGSSAGAWEFIRQHLEQLPMPTLNNDRVEVQGERMPFLLYDRMVAFHLVRGLTVPLSSSEFYQGLSQRWLARDGMYFTAAQATTYDQLRLKAESVQQLALFVTDEVSAIQWLRGELSSETGHGPQTYSELQPSFVRQWHPGRFEQLPELLVILEQNFLRDDQERWFVPDPDNTAHLEALREYDLLREFNEYQAGTGKIKVFRSEAVKAGFSKAWGEHRYADIIKVAERLPEQALQEDPKLKLYYDNALNRAPKEMKQEKLI